MNKSKFNSYYKAFALVAVIISGATINTAYALSSCYGKGSAYFCSGACADGTVFPVTLACGRDRFEAENHWLEDAIPACDGHGGIIHGDFECKNMNGKRESDGVGDIINGERRYGNGEISEDELAEIYRRFRK